MIFSKSEKTRFYAIIDTYDRTKYGCGWSTVEACAEVGDSETLRWLKEIDLRFSTLVVMTAIQKGYLEMIKWLAVNDSSWNYFVFTYAQIHGDERVKKWLLSQTCPSE